MRNEPVSFAFLLPGAVLALLLAMESLMLTAGSKAMPARRLPNEVLPLFECVRLSDTKFCHNRLPSAELAVDCSCDLIYSSCTCRRDSQQQQRQQH